MSRHRLPTIGRRPAAVRPQTRRTKLALGLGAVVALLAVAAFIGSRDGVETARATGGFTSTLATEVPSPGVDRPATSGETASADGFGYTDEDQSTSATEAAAPGGAGAAADSGRQLGAAVAPKVVRTGSIAVLVGDGKFDQAVGQLTTIAAGAGGFVAASQTSALADNPQGSVTLRVPAERFDDVLGQVRKLGNVESADTSSQDVTGEYTDIEARLSALKSEREQITLILGRAETIPDILSVRDRLSVVQSELEQLEGRQQVLDDQTALSTITVGLREKSNGAPYTPPTQRSGLSGLWHDAVDRFTDGGRAIALGLASMAPWLLLGLVLFLPARALWRRTAPPAPPSPATDAGIDA